MKVEMKNESFMKKETSKNFLDSEEISRYVANVLQRIKGLLKNAGQYIDEELKPILREWVNVFGTKVVFLDEEFLTAERLFNIIRENKVDDADSNIVYRKVQSDGTVEILVSFMKNGELLPSDKNKNICINTEGVSKDLKKIFEEKDVVIIK